MAMGSQVALRSTAQWLTLLLLLLLLPLVRASVWAASGQARVPVPATIGGETVMRAYTPPAKTRTLGTLDLVIKVYQVGAPGAAHDEQLPTPHRLWLT